MRSTDHDRPGICPGSSPGSNGANAAREMEAFL
jgi:hypothetical protein